MTLILYFNLDLHLITQEMIKNIPKELLPLLDLGTEFENFKNILFNFKKERSSFTFKLNFNYIYHLNFNTLCTIYNQTDIVDFPFEVEEDEAILIEETSKDNSLKKSSSNVLIETHQTKKDVLKDVQKEVNVTNSKDLKKRISTILQILKERKNLDEILKMKLDESSMKILELIFEIKENIKLGILEEEEEEITYRTLEIFFNIYENQKTEKELDENLKAFSKNEKEYRLLKSGIGHNEKDLVLKSVSCYVSIIKTDKSDKKWKEIFYIYRYIMGGKRSLESIIRSFKQYLHDF